MGHPVSIETPGGRIGGWRADPPVPAKGALVLLQEIFGVNAHIRRVADRFAAQLGHARGNRSRGEAARFQHKDLFAA